MSKETKNPPARVRNLNPHRVKRTGSVSGLEPEGEGSIPSTLTKDPKKVKAGRARWLSMSADERKKFTSKAGKKGGAATREKWLKLNANPLSTG